MKLNKNSYVIIGVIVVILFIIFTKAPTERKEAPSEALKGATAGYEATRVFSGGSGPKHVTAGNTITATYDNVAGNYMGVIEVAPAGWTASPVSPSPDGKYRFTTDYGTDFILTWTAPSTTGSYTFTGEYFVDPDSYWTPFTSDIIEVCNHHGYSLCYNGDRYWYTSSPCDDLQDMREACDPTPCGTYGANYCSVLTIKHDRTCYTEGCTADTCTDTPYTDTETVIGAPNSASGVCAWQCSGGACEQNTVGDTSYDGCVHDTEFPPAVNDWKGPQTYVSDVNFPPVVNNWKSQANC